MTDLSPITNYLCEAIDTTAANIEKISPKIEQACQLLTQTLLSDKKILICSNGLASPIGNLFSAYLTSQQEFARPSLPAINLSMDPTNILSISKSTSQHQVFANQLYALGHEGDTLVTFSIDGNCSNILQAIQAAHEKNMHVIAFSGFDTGKTSAILQPEDIDIHVESKSVARIIEIQLLTVNSLSHQLDATLFGGMH